MASIGGGDLAPRIVTGSIESDADLTTVLAVLADPRGIPEWAPDFADSVSSSDTSGWRATKDGRDFALRVEVRHDAGTVDYLRTTPDGKEVGAYIRAIPRPGDGSVIVMTLPLPPGASTAEVAATMQRELVALEGSITSGGAPD